VPPIDILLRQVNIPSNKWMFRSDKSMFCRLAHTGWQLVRFQQMIGSSVNKYLIEEV
jgi:hypothetical protein